MICDVCKTNTATVYLTQIVDGNMKKINLCESCSKDKGVSDPTGFALADLLLGLGETQQVEQAPPTEHCPVCGLQAGSCVQGLVSGGQVVVIWVCTQAPCSQPGVVQALVSESGHGELSGTAVEIAPIRSIDRLTVGAGKRGPITETLQNAFFGLFTGKTADKWGWLDYVDMAAPRAAVAAG